jgi:peptidoglycan/xylan/chitin deacetylase (PgdA/CDA1 family)
MAERRERWVPTPLLRGSFALHALAVASVALRPWLWPWALGAVAANHALLTAAGLWPRSSLLGPNLTRLPPERRSGRVAITVDDGPDPEVTPVVLDILEQHRARATFFCIGERVAAHPALARAIVARGHLIENHSQRHLNRFSLLGPRALSAEITQAQETISQITGRAPRLFRAPAGLRNPFLEPVLHRCGLKLVSWTRRGFDTVSRNPEIVLAKLTRDLAAGDILLVHDGHAARAADGTPVVRTVLPRLLDACAAAGLATVTLPEVLP